MYQHRTSIAIAMLATLFTSPYIAFAQGAYGDDSIPAGCHPITTEERAGLLAMNATIPANGMFCDKDKGLLYGGCAENPYPYLQSKNKTGRTETVSGLNSDFACRMYKFFKAADAAGQNIAIGSGYRSVEHQTDLYKKYLACNKCGAPVAPPGRSKHNFGLAIDLHYNGAIGPRNTAQCVASLAPCKWAHANYAQYGLRYPMEYEPWHIEPAGTVNGRQQPLPQGGWTGDESTTPYTNTGVPYNPSMWQPYMAPQPQQFSPLGSSGSTGVSAPTGQTTDTGTSYPTNYNGIPLPTATSSIFTVPPPYTYQFSTSSATGTSTLSAYEQILLIARATSSRTSQSTPTSTSAPTQLNDDLYDIVTDSNTGGTNAPDNTLAYATNSVPLNPIHVTETFTNTGQQQPTQVTQTVANQSLIVSLLTTLRDFLATYLNILKSQQTYGFQAPWRPVTPASPFMR